MDAAAAVPPPQARPALCAIPATRGRALGARSARPYAVGANDLRAVESYKTASFIVLDANPLRDIGNTRRITSVYLRGPEIGRATIKATCLPGGTAVAVGGGE